MIDEIQTTKEIQLTHVWIQVPVRYEDQDIPYDFPFRTKNVWTPAIELDTGRVVDWPKGVSANVYLKVCDSGRYNLMDNGMIVETIHDYVPAFIPNEYGDYINFDINEDGVILNWYNPESIKDMIEEYLNENS
jgi:hypothetical protein